MVGHENVDVAIGIDIAPTSECGICAAALRLAKAPEAAKFGRLFLRVRRAPVNGDFLAAVSAIEAMRNARTIAFPDPAGPVAPLRAKPRNGVCAGAAIHLDGATARGAI